MPISPVRVRFAPSPTGRFHIGGARTALYDYLIAQQTSGQFILRIEDTDRKRFVPGAEEELIQSLHWLGIEWDEGPEIGGPYAPYRQSERTEIYQQHAHLLVENGNAYYCFCSPQRLSRMRQEMQKRKQPPRYDGTCRRLDPSEAMARVEAGESCVIRFKTPREGTTTGVDLLRGPIHVDNATLDDFILLKSDGLPVYHLAAMVDDHLMHITHVLRGSEWLPTFPLHVLIFQAFGWEQPEWVHLSVFLNPSGKGKLSKRQAVDPKSGVKAIHVLDLKEMAYLPEAVTNWIALMGWSYDDRTEHFTMQDLIQKFSLEKLVPSPAAVNFSKLDHFNGVHIRALPLDDLVRRLRPHFEAAGIHPLDDQLRSIAPLIQERIRTLDDAVEIAGFFFRQDVEPDPKGLIGKNMDVVQSAFAAQKAHEVIAGQASMDTDVLESALRELAQSLELSAGQLFSILRMAVTGQKVSPPLIESMEVIGKQKVLERIANAVRILESQA
ncbi:MAG: glutamate--tRNA ligase [Anaerolineales bacterium]|jgi:glutamyl-tRNA synthetase